VVWFATPEPKGGSSRFGCWGAWALPSCLYGPLPHVRFFFISHFLNNLFTKSHLFVMTYDMLPFCVLDPQTRILEQVVVSPLVWRSIQVGLVLYSSCEVCWGAHRSKYTVFTIPQCFFVALLLEKKLLDLPKLLDICAIYEHDNNKLTSSLVSPWSSFFVILVILSTCLSQIFNLKSTLFFCLNFLNRGHLCWQSSLSAPPGYKCY